MRPIGMCVCVVCVLAGGSSVVEVASTALTEGWTNALYSLVARPQRGYPLIHRHSEVSGGSTPNDAGKNLPPGLWVPRGRQPLDR